PYAPFVADRLRARFYMERMGVAAALDAIRKPAELAGRPFAEGVAEQLADNLRQVRVPGQEATVAGQYVEPVQLQVVCYQLWENIKNRPSGLITTTDLAEAGDVDRALTQFYEETLAAALADPAAAGVSERQIRAWFNGELITEAGTRGLVHQGESDAGGLPNGVVRALQRRFLVRAEARGGDTWVELVHDRFVEPIRASNAAWFSRNLNSLTLAAQAWLDAGKPASALYRGSQLAAAAEQIAANPAEFGEMERDFVEAGQQTEMRSTARRQRAIAWGAATLALIFMALAGWALMQKQTAEAYRILAIEALATSESNLKAALTSRVGTVPSFTPTLAPIPTTTPPLGGTPTPTIEPTRTGTAVPDQTVVVLQTQLAHVQATQAVLVTSTATRNLTLVQSDFVYVVAIWFDIILRSEPNIDTESLARIQKGERARVVDTSRAPWLLVEANNGMFGWIYGRYYVFEGNRELFPNDLRHHIISNRNDLPFIYGKVINLDENIVSYDLRSAPNNETGDVIISVPIGTEIIMLLTRRGEFKDWSFVTLADPYGKDKAWFGYLPTEVLTEMPKFGK
ncbi:MAG: SH3 domain-containing protein, partial [Anaerolineae bacterium]